MATNDISQLSVKGVCIGQEHVHTLHFKHLGPATTEQLLIDRWQSAARIYYRNMFYTSDSPVQLITARQVCGSVPLRAAAEEAEVAPNIVGVRAPSGDYASPHDATVVSIRTALAGKSYRGRNYLGGMFEQDKAAGIITTAHYNWVEDYFAKLLAAFGPSGTDGAFQWFVFSPTLAATPGTQCQNAGAPVTGYIVRTQVATMRSRKIGHGS